MPRREEHDSLTLASWAGAVVRGFSPGRLLLCCVALLASALIGALALAWFSATPLSVQPWWDDPLQPLQQLRRELFEQASGTALRRCLPLAAVLAMVWGPVAGWIARAELLWHRPAIVPVVVSPTKMVATRLTAFAFPLPMALIFAGLCLFPGMLGGVIARIPLGLGALIVSLNMPVLFFTSLGAAVILVGAASFTLMPAVVAAEGSDTFDAVSRGYSYVFTRLFHFLVYCVLTSLVAALLIVGPFLSQDAGFDETLASLLRGAGLVLGVSVFWSLQPLVYLRLRRLVDATPERQLWDGPPVVDQDDGSVAQAPAVDQEAAAERDRNFDFARTLPGARLASSGQMIMVLAAGVWTAAVLGGTWFAWNLLGPGQPLAAADLREAIIGLAQDQPFLLAGLFLVVVMLSIPGLSKPMRMALRLAAVRAVHQVYLQASMVRSAADTTSLGWVAALLLASGSIVYLSGAFLVPLVLMDLASWNEAAALGALGILLFALGALSLAGRVVEANRSVEQRADTLEIHLGNALETLASGLIAAILGPCCLVVWAGFAGLASWLLVESLGWFGANLDWLQWNVPADVGALAYVAHLLSRLWIALLVGAVLVYPLAYVLSWAACCYLRARFRSERHAREPLIVLTDEEGQALEALHKKPRKAETTQGPASQDNPS